MKLKEEKLVHALIHTLVGKLFICSPQKINALVVNIKTKIASMEWLKAMYRISFIRFNNKESQLNAVSRLEMNKGFLMVMFTTMAEQFMNMVE